MANLGANFYPKLVQISNELGMKPEDLLAVMTSESGINPSAYESKFHGSGLLGFMPDTLKGLGFKGSWNDFINLTGEDQLDYVKKLVQNNMSLNEGKPFTSAAQYYTANLWPIALKLPGVQEGDPNTAFIEANPETVIDPQTGKKYSKKYYELGYRISPAYENAAYKANPLFHGSMPGAITYGDMIRQVEKNKQNPIYQKALAQMQAQTGYQPTKQIDQEPQTNSENDAISNIQSLLSQFMSALAKSYTTQYKKANMKKDNIIIKITSNDFWSSMEFARILCLALDEELDIMGSIYTDTNNVEIGCKINKDQHNLLNKICNKVSIMFNNSIEKYSNTKITTNLLTNISPNYQECSIKLAEISYTVFHNNIGQK